MYSTRRQVPALVVQIFWLCHVPRWIISLPSRYCNHINPCILHISVTASSLAMPQPLATLSTYKFFPPLPSLFRSHVRLRPIASSGGRPLPFLPFRLIAAPHFTARSTISSSAPTSIPCSRKASSLMGREDTGERDGGREGGKSCHAC
jgi:hypothetical protein